MRFLTSVHCSQSQRYQNTLCQELVLCPQLSPKKTWEGFIGGFFATVLFGLLVGSGFWLGGGVTVAPNASSKPVRVREHVSQGQGLCPTGWDVALKKGTSMAHSNWQRQHQPFFTRQFSSSLDPRGAEAVRTLYFSHAEACGTQQVAFSSRHLIFRGQGDWHWRVRGGVRYALQPRFPPLCALT